MENDDVKSNKRNFCLTRPHTIHHLSLALQDYNNFLFALCIKTSSSIVYMIFQDDMEEAEMHTHSGFIIQLFCDFETGKNQ